MPDVANVRFHSESAYLHTPRVASIVPVGFVPKCVGTFLARLTFFAGPAIAESALERRDCPGGRAIAYEVVGRE